MVTLSEKALAVNALSRELKRLEESQLRVGAMQALLISRQTVLAARYDGVQNALKKLLK